MFPILRRQIIQFNPPSQLKAVQVRGWHNLREKYLRKSPVFRIDPDGTYHVEGVSNKQNPIPILWVPPEQIQRVQPGEDGSGDLEGLPEVDLTRPPVELRDSPLWEKAPSEVRRVLSLEFGRNRQKIDVITSDLIKKVQEHQHDFSSLPVVIARLTITIRNMQRDLAERYPNKNQALKHSLKIVVDSRRLVLAYLLEQDYKKFEWLLEKLNIVYKPRPFEFENIKRFVLQERLVDLWCDELKHHRLQCYKEELESEQPKFLREKAEKLKWILQQEKDLGVKPTVTQEEIDECYERASRIEAKLKTKATEWPYHIYEQEVKTPENIFRHH